MGKAFAALLLASSMLAGATDVCAMGGGGGGAGGGLGGPPLYQPDTARPTVWELMKPTPLPKPVKPKHKHIRKP